MTTTSAMSGCFSRFANAHVDGQRLLHRRLLIAAGAVAVRPADHHEALAEVPHVDLERGELTVGQADPGDVHQHDAVVGSEPREIGRQGLRHDPVHLLALALQGLDQFRGDHVVARQDERPRLALDDRVGVGAVILAERVARGLDPDAERVEARFRRLDVEGHAGDARVEVDRLGGDLRAVREEEDRGRLGDRRADLRDRFDRFAEACSGRGDEPFDHDLVDVAEADLARLDLHAPAGGEGSLGLPRSGGVVPVAQEHDPLLGVVGEQRGRQPEGGSDVRRGLHRRGRDSVDLLELGRQPFDERVLAERDDAGHVARWLLLERLPQERKRVRTTGIADRRGQVDDEHRRQPIDRKDELEAGDREHERREHDGPQDECGPSPTRTHAPACTDVQADRQGQRWHEHQQRERRLERDAHLARPARLPAESRDQGPAQADHRIPVEEGPFDAQPDKDQEHDGQPQLVARGRPLGRRSHCLAAPTPRERCPALRWRPRIPARSSTPRHRTGRPRSGPARSDRPATPTLPGTRTVGRSRPARCRRSPPRRPRDPVMPPPSGSA